MMQNECNACGSQDNTLQKIDSGHGYSEILCADCRESSVEMGEKLDRVRDLNAVEDALDEMIKMYDIQDSDQLPQTELANHLDSVVNKIFELRKEIQDRKDQIKEPLGEDSA